MKKHYLPICILIPLLGLSYYAGYTPLLIPALFVSVSLLTLAIYYKDKSAAVAGAWRTPESRLHLLALLGGWPGAIIAQQTLRHKTQKKSFRVTFWLTLLLNISTLGWLHTTTGSDWLHGKIFKLDSYIAYSDVSYMARQYMRYFTHFRVKRPLRYR
ncbi:DUF1294 domain-containing protein [Amphritea sp. 2_MG-2023]|uniref:DUF1294 domain-containing protein n=1 Tax=Amphritea TaxID=515417 RepID=UPI001C07A87A|nr:MULTISPECIES: DUF1294 domain-containing protein [Amphritea]MBU2966020.1 DUF1294 domain-containing protein [Amphritea atlantica]MDO6418110.1 DUF1294 domain-containing protein [Amphritea sp. 2_MG-2023]